MSPSGAKHGVNDTDRYLIPTSGDKDAFLTSWDLLAFSGKNQLQGTV